MSPNGTLTVAAIPSNSSPYGSGRVAAILPFDFQNKWENFFWIFN
jgi:hypothetical protein